MKRFKVFVGRLFLCCGCWTLAIAAGFQWREPPHPCYGYVGAILLSLGSAFYVLMLGTSEGRFDAEPVP